MQKKLLAAENKYVRLFNNADEQMEGAFRFHVHGILRHFAKDQDPWSVIIGECPHGHGTNYISFTSWDVLDVSNSPSGIVCITLR